MAEPVAWTEQDEALFKERIKDRLPLGCACTVPDPGQTLCPCDRVRAEVRQEIIRSRLQK